VLRRRRIVEVDQVNVVRVQIEIDDAVIVRLSAQRSVTPVISPGSRSALGACSWPCA
jgi:hypothetical protein